PFPTSYPKCVPVGPPYPSLTREKGAFSGPLPAEGRKRNDENKAPKLAFCPGGHPCEVHFAVCLSDRAPKHGVMTRRYFIQFELVCQRETEDQLAGVVRAGR